MKELIKIILDHKQELENLNAYDFVEKFNEIVEAYSMGQKQQFLALINNRMGNYEDEGSVYIIDESISKIIYSYGGSNCSCYSWTDYKEFQIVKDILGDIENHECKEKEGN